MDPRVADAVWKAIEGHLPPRPPDNHPLGCHRPRIPDRDCFDGILVRLVTGCSWDVAARLCKASETTLRARRTQWLAAGVFDKLVEEAIAGYDRIIGLDLSEVAVDGSLHKANLDSGPRTTVAAPGGVAVYGRYGQPCLRCGTPVQTRRQGEQARTTYWCPQCQPARQDASAT